MLPQVEGLDAFHLMKDQGTAYRRPDRYEAIAMPRNSMFGMVMGALAFVIGFAAVWYIWWISVAAMAVAVIVLILRAGNDNTESVLTAAEVEAIEDARFADMAKAPTPDLTDVPVGVPGAPIPAASP
jgi:cytochrome o ubiquinol oxidase subunit 1